MEISVQGTHEQTVRPEVARLHARAHAEAGGKDEVLRTATDVVQQLSGELNRLKEAGAVRSELSRKSVTSAVLRAGRVPEPEKMTSSMPDARMFL